MFSIPILDQLREAELEMAAVEFRPGARVLDFGAGTGAQSRKLAELGFDVVAIDLPSSGYARSRVHPVIEYDGDRIPLPDDSIDIIYSSNVLEHVGDFAATAREMRRITRPGGYGIHIMPSVPWRIWTSLSGIPNAALIAGVAAGHLLRPPAGSGRASAMSRDLKMFAGSILPLGHGTSFESLSELWSFSAAAWRRRFRRHGFTVERDRPTGLFYTGHSLIGDKMSLDRRRRLAPRLGSATNLFVVRPA